MLRHLLFFEWKFYNRKISFYVMLLSFFGFGILIGTTAAISFPNITNNSPYTINFILGLFSLVSLFPIVVLASQSLLREKDNHFEQILYSTPITIRNYFISRFLLVLGVAVISFLLFILGYMLGHIFEMDGSEKWGDFHLKYYLYSFFVIALPNVFLCAAIVTCMAWFSKNKMLIYLSGLGIYVLYVVVSIFSNSPLMANASPVSDNAMKLAAKLDPFGMAAFFEQTRHWTALERNTEVLQLTGNILINRTAVVLFAFALLFAAYRFFKFKVSTPKKKKIVPINEVVARKHIYVKTETKPKGKWYFISTIITFLTIDLKFAIKSIPFALLVTITLFVVGMEMYGAIDGGIRLPENYVTSGLMINTILVTIPIILLVAMLFYGSELVWKSNDVFFYAIEKSTPFSNIALFISKFITLTHISFILIFFSIILALVFQVIYQYPIIDWTAYLSLFYFIGLPTAQCALFIIAMQYIIKNKYIALSVAALFLVMTNSTLGKNFGFGHPLTRFANFLPDVFSDINSFGYFSKIFLVNMLYSLFFTMVFVLVAMLFFNKSVMQSFIKIKLSQVFIFALPIVAMIITGIYIATKSNLISKNSKLDWQQHYEEKYKKYKSSPQPNITEVKTNIDLFPEQNSYKVNGSYILVNKTKSIVSEILINTSKEISWNSIQSSQLTLVKKDVEFGQYLFRSKKQILPDDSISLQFNFEYKIEPLQGHQSFNAIVENGAFMRISNYFPTIGYDVSNEIENELERKERKMPLPDPIKKVNASHENPYNHEFINLDAIISTSVNQTAISVGELKNKYTNNNRNFFHYVAKDIPFRFAVSSAKYAVKKSKYNNIAIEVFYHPLHHQNINHLIENIKRTLAYCETNFGKYPYNTVRFAEISSFTKGFAATSYPVSAFINEEQLHVNILADKQQDIIGELVGHELSHLWWGNAQLHPDYREGSGVLTETLAQYTQLMLYKNQYGKDKMLEMVSLHQNLYESEAAFSGEEPLYISNPNNSNVIYNKGLVKMYELYLLIDEEKINLALKKLLAKHKFPNQPATTLDLIEELKAASESGKHRAIDELFKK